MPRRHASTRAVFLLLAMTVSLPALAIKQPHHPKIHVHEQILALEDQWRTAQMNNDIATMDKLLSDDFLGITGNGQVVTKAQQLDRMKAHQFNLTRVDMSDAKIKVVGSVAIVTSLAQIEGTSDGAPLKGEFRYTRIYQRLPSGTWKITSFEATRVPPNLRAGNHPGTEAANTTPPTSAQLPQK